MTISDEYAAGFFDGEGSVYATKRMNGPHVCPMVLVCISNTDRRPLDALAEKWGGSINARSNIKPRHRQQYQWVLSTRGVKPFLLAIREHLIIKADVADAALELCALKAMPARERIDYSGRAIGKGGKLWCSARIRPEFKRRVDDAWAAIRQLNARGYNARRA